jgi:hypothetical protein
MPKKNTEQHFWNKVVRGVASQCWPYIQSRDKDGYGQFYYHGKNWRSHRLAWYFTHGDIPMDHCVLHRCDNPCCCNPQHLWLGTVEDNVQDMIRKGRHRNQITGRCAERMHVKRKGKSGF